MERVRTQAGPLVGLRVVDFTTNVPGPQTTKVLQRMGATIVKIEPPRGDSARLLPELFERLNHGKSCLRIDLRTPQGRARARRAIAEADVLIESFRPGVMRRFGLGAPEVLARHPSLVYCSITGFGQTGPHADLPAHDLNLQAMSGLAHLLRDRDGQPRPATLPVADFSASATAVYEILAALRVRDQTGRGAHLDVALVDAVADWVQTWSHGVRPDAGRVRQHVRCVEARWAERGGLRAAIAERGLLRGLTRRVLQGRWFAELSRMRLHALPHYGVFETKDGRHLSVAIVDEQKFWRTLCERCSLSWLAHLPLAARVVLSAPLRAALQHAFARRTRDEWVAVLGTALPVAPVLTADEAALAAPRTRGVSSRTPRPDHQPSVCLRRPSMMSADSNVGWPS